MEDTQTESVEETTETVGETQTESVEETTETVEDTQTESVEETTETVEQTQTETVEETTENETSAIRENVVYVSYLPSNFSENDARVSACPEGFSLVSYVEKEKTQIAQPISEFVFYGEKYELKYQSTKKYTLFGESSGKIISVSSYNSGDSVYLSIVDGTNKLTSLSILDKRTPDPNAKTISKDEAENIA